MATSIPGPAAPRTLQTVHWILDPVDYMRRHFQRFGDIIRIRFYGVNPANTYLVSDPASMQQILTNDTGRIFSSPGEFNEILASILGRSGTILLSGSRHRQRRQLVMPRFHGEVLQEYARSIAAITSEEIAGWPVGEVREMRPLMHAITMRVILKVVFGLDQGKRYETILNLLSRRLEMTATPVSSAVLFFPWLQNDVGPWSPGGRMRRRGEEIDALLFEEIEERRAAGRGDRTDVLSVLLHATDEKGEGLTDQELRDELMTLLVAGHETTATALTAALYWLHRTPTALEKLRQELQAMAASPEPEPLLRLPYLAAVCQEALRIHPVAMLTFPRRAEVPVECCGHLLSPGDVVMGSIYQLHQREDLYPNPDEFRPERFLERQYSPYEYMPFGAGVRRCVGAALAQQEMKIVLGMVVGQLRLSPMNPKPVPQARRGVTLGHGAPVLLRREPSS
jgi:cytochrome P450